MRILSACCIAFLKAYQWVVSPIFQSFGVQCRFEPSCSHYTLEAVRRHGPVTGVGLGLGRIIRCHPFCEGGHDPVPSYEKERHYNHG